jgi:hypothetical protein
MSRLRITALAAALIATASLTGATAAPASAAARPHAHIRPDITGIGIGYGGKDSTAEVNAVFNLSANYVGCGSYTLVEDIYSGGFWTAEVTATCTAKR